MRQVGLHGYTASGSMTKCDAQTPNDDRRLRWPPNPTTHVLRTHPCTIVRSAPSTARTCSHASCGAQLAKAGGTLYSNDTKLLVRARECSACGAIYTSKHVCSPLWRASATPSSMRSSPTAARLPTTSKRGASTAQIVWLLYRSSVTQSDAIFSAI